MSNIITVDDKQFEAEVTRSEKPVLALFKSEWCPSCKRLTPVVEKVSDGYKDSIKFALIDIVSNAKTTVDNNVLAIPTLILFKGGKEAERLTGYIPEADLKAFLDKNI